MTDTSGEVGSGLVLSSNNAFVVDGDRQQMMLGFQIYFLTKFLFCFFVRPKRGFMYSDLGIPNRLIKDVSCFSISVLVEWVKKRKEIILVC